MVKNGTKGFNVRLLWREKAHDRNGERRISRIYNTAIEAENNAFSFRYSNESNFSKWSLMIIRRVYFNLYLIRLMIPPLSIQLIHNPIENAVFLRRFEKATPCLVAGN